MNIKEFLDLQKQEMENQLSIYISNLTAPPVLKDAMSYSLQAGGKRIRPLLLAATLHAFGKDANLGMPIACAIEMIHTYSLIHDDLPSMDNDDLRRGLPTNHKIYGEATAILAGDGLLTYSFQLIAEDQSISPESKVKLIAELAKAAGPEGMVAGQIADMEAEGATLNLDELEYIHKNKTGKLLTISIIAGGILANATMEQLKTLENFAIHLGLAFQIRDDILDIEGEEEVIGKPVGSDSTNDKNTYPSLLTLDGAKEKLTYHTNEAKASLNAAGVDVEILDYLCDLVASRNN